MGGLRSPHLQYSLIHSVVILGRGSSQISDLHLQSPISNVVILGRIQSDLRSPSPISNLQSRFGGPGEEGGSNLQGDALWIHSQCKRISTLFSRHFCNLQSAHTISRRLWREVRISTSVARSQATARTNSRSQTPLEHLHRRRFASTNSSSIYCSEPWLSGCQVLSGDLSGCRAAVRHCQVPLSDQLSGAVSAVGCCRVHV